MIYIDCYDIIFKMNQIATITSKMQLTIPVGIAKKAGFKRGQKVLVTYKKGGVNLSPLLNEIEQLAGSLKLPENLKGKNIDEIIENAKREYFKKRE